ncbi:MAG: hypothetical protein MJK04_12865, partial [Psychrosphaera sp.]|nr:hypothetical protein [Psychrosphaera sp.]
MTKTTLLLTTILLLISINANASAKTHFETRICRGCDYNHALATATALKPAISCTGVNDPFDPNSAAAQSCYATPVKVLVVDADTRVMWGFENTYSNQGQPLYNLSNKVTYTPNLPNGTATLVNQLLNNYQALHRMTVEMTEELAQENSLLLSRSVDEDPCKNSGHKEALEAVFSPLV